MTKDLNSLNKNDRITVDGEEYIVCSKPWSAKGYYFIQIQPSDRSTSRRLAKFDEQFNLQGVL